MIAGRVPSKPDPRTLHISQLPKLPVPPPRYAATDVPTWPVLGNDEVPCCTCAAAAHMIHNWTAAHDAAVVLSKDQVVATFVVVSGGAPDGAAMLDVLRFWRRSGIGDRRLRAYVALDPHAKEDVQASIYVFGAAYLGLSFPDFALEDAADDRVWELPEGGATGENAPNPKNGHCVAAVAYDADGLRVVSCGVLRRMTWEFYQAYNDEAYAVLSRDWYGNERRSPSGFDLAELQREITALQLRIPEHRIGPA